MTICIRCADLLVYDDALRVQPVSPDDQLNMLVENPGLLAAVERVQLAVASIHAKQ